MTTNRLQRLLVALAACAAAVPVPAHEVDCTRLAALAVRSPDGPGPLLDPGGLPSLAGSPRTGLVIDGYPALVAFEDRIQNLATEPSILTAVADALPTDPARVLSFGDVLAGTIPVGGTLRRVHTVAVMSQQDCMDLFPQDPPEAAWCGGVRENALLVTTESNIASCRAHVVCAAQKAPPPPAECTSPTWSGSLNLPLIGVALSNGVTVSCDGSSWIAGSFFRDLLSPHQAIFRVDREGQVSTIPLEGAAASVRVDRDGLIHVAGQRDLQDPPRLGAVVRQLDPTGAIRWEYVAGDYVPLTAAVKSEVGGDVDGASRVYFAYRTVVTGRGSEIALAKLGPDGTLLWTRKLGTDGDDELGRLVVTEDGAVFVGGKTSGTFPGETSAGGADAFVAHLDSDGDLRWVRQFGTAGADAGGVAVARDGSRVALYGTTTGPLDGGAPAGPSHAFVAVFDASGALEWVRELRADPVPELAPILPRTIGAAAAIDPSGAVWLGGTVQLGALPGAAYGRTEDGFVARFDATGTPLWARQLGHGVDAQLTDLAIDRSGSAVATQNLRMSLSRREVAVVRLSPDGT